MEKFFTFDRVATTLFISLLALIGFTAFASEFGAPIGKIATLSLFVLMVAIGLGLAGAGSYQLLTEGKSHIFGSFGLIAFGVLGVMMGVSAQESLSGHDPNSYRNFLQNHFMGLAGIACALIGAHIIVEKPIIKNQRRTTAG